MISHKLQVLGYVLELEDDQHHSSGNWILLRAVESESPKVGKSREKSESRIKSEKSDLISYKTFWQKCQNALICQNACTLGQGPTSEYFF